MKVKIIMIALMVMFQLTQAQKLISKNGHVWFYSQTPMENIEGHNHQVVSILDPSTGDMQFSLLVKAFEFKVALMQEHFNENYMESDKFPKASFKGKITNLDKINFKKDGVYQAEVLGDLTIHNVTRPVTARGSIEVRGTSVIARSKFVVTPHDYAIVIPSLVEEKIAKEIEVNVEATYTAN